MKGSPYYKESTLKLLVASCSRTGNNELLADHPGARFCADRETTTPSDLNTRFQTQIDRFAGSLTRPGGTAT